EAQVLDAATGNVVRSVVREAPEGTALFDLVDPLAEELAEALGVAAAPSSLAGLTTASLEAYRSYDRGMRAFGRIDLANAREELERAVATDPGFALAWSK